MLPGIGVFGCGKITKLLVPCLREKGFPVEGIWGFNEKLAKETSKELNIPFFTSTIDVLLLKKEVQVIIISCPPHIHSQIVSKSLNIGKHVLCDWPTALNLEDTRRMVKAATYYPSLISILCHPLRYLRSFQVMKELVGKGMYTGELTVINANVSGAHLLDLGEVYSIKCDHNMGGGLLTNFGSHIIDAISFITGLRAERVHGILRTFVHEIKDDSQNPSAFRSITVDDFCTFQMEMESENKKKSSPLSLVTIMDHLKGQFNLEITVSGKDGYLALRGDKLYGSRKMSDLSIKVPQLNHSSQNEEDPEEVLLFCENEEEEVYKNYFVRSSLPKPFILGLLKLISSLRDAFKENESIKANGSIPNDTNVEFKFKLSNGSESESELDLFSHWSKSAVHLAANFEDGEYIQAVIDAIKHSSHNKEWTRVNFKLPSSPSLRVNGI